MSLFYKPVSKIFEKDGQKYCVEICEDGVIKSYQVYAYHPERRFFKKSYLNGYVEPGLWLEMQGKLNRDSEDYIYRCMEIALNMALNARERRAQQAIAAQKQLQYLKNK